MKKAFLRILILLSFINVKANAQTTASYFFSAFSSTYSSIASTGTGMGSSWFGDDRTQTGIGLGFTFNYCLTNYTTLSICSNGWTSFPGSGSITWTNTAGNIASAGWLFPFWDDLITHSPGGYYQTTGTAPNRIFTMEWVGVTLYPAFSSSAPSGNFQMKLYETSNVIEYWYGSNSYTSNSASIGISNSTTDYRTLPDFGTSPTPNTTFNTVSGFPVANQVYRWSPCPVTVTASASAAVCPGGTVTLTGTTTGTSWSWTGPSGYTSTSLSPVLTGVTASGAYVLVASNGTCTMNATTTVTVNPTPPVPVISPTATATICNGASLALSSSAAGVWSPSTYLFMDAAFTTPYTGGTTSTVYMYPTTVTVVTPITYTVT
ncbi:MAG: hypothetical protein K9G49_09465, partial [Taibaiella sp.]|nr:hypothetical protein [Taibaiella sp.]